MAANTNPQAIRMIAAINEAAGEADATEFSEKFTLSKSADIEKKFVWAENICEYLKEKYDDGTIMSIREKCFCSDGKSAAKRMISYLNKTDSIKAFTEMYNKNEKYGTLEFISENEFYACYPQCYCSCVKNIDKTLPKEWCYCTVGYSKRLYSEVFGKTVEARLIESVKTGGKRCAVSIVI